MTLTAEDIAALDALLARWADPEAGAVKYADIPKSTRITLMTTQAKLGIILKGFEVPVEL